MGESWRVVLASGEVREVQIGRGRRGYVALGSSVRGLCPRWCVSEFTRVCFGEFACEILAPGEPTRADLAAQIAAVTALRPRDPHRTGHRCACCGREGAPGADDVCPWCSDGLATQREHAVLRAQQEPLVTCVDAFRAAARAAGWHDADATGESLVAWVRRGALIDAARIALERGGERVAKAIVARANEEGGG